MPISEVINKMLTSVTSVVHVLVVYGCVSGAIWGAWSIHLTLVGLELNVTGRVCGEALLW